MKKGLFGVISVMIILSTLLRWIGIVWEVNVELKFKYSNIAVFRIVEFKNKKYILDSTTIKGKSYFFGLLPKEVSAEMVELSPSNDNLVFLEFLTKVWPKFD